MKKLLLLPLVLLPFQALSETSQNYFEITYFAHATHKPFIDENMVLINNKLDMLSVAYRNEKHGIEFSKFTNSYFNKSIAVSYARYWHPSKNVETSIHVGGVTGYSETPVIFVASVAYTKYDMFVPKVSWFGEALVFSLSFKYKF